MTTESYDDAYEPQDDVSEDMNETDWPGIGDEYEHSAESIEGLEWARAEGPIPPRIYPGRTQEIVERCIKQHHSFKLLHPRVSLLVSFDSTSKDPVSRAFISYNEAGHPRNQFHVGGCLTGDELTIDPENHLVVPSDGTGPWMVIRMFADVGGYRVQTANLLIDRLDECKIGPFGGINTWPAMLGEYVPKKKLKTNPNQSSLGVFE